MNTFSELVKSRLEKKKISLRELCRRSGMDPSFLSKVLAGKRNPPSEDDILARLAGALEVSPEELFVSAGRLPREWSRLQGDKRLFEHIRRLVEAGDLPLAVAAVNILPAIAPASAVPEVPRDRSYLSEELL